ADDAAATAGCAADAAGAASGAGAGAGAEAGALATTCGCVGGGAGCGAEAARLGLRTTFAAVIVLGFLAVWARAFASSTAGGVSGCSTRVNIGSAMACSGGGPPSASSAHRSTHECR